MRPQLRVCWCRYPGELQDRKPSSFISVQALALSRVRVRTRLALALAQLQCQSQTNARTLRFYPRPAQALLGSPHYSTVDARHGLPSYVRLQMGPGHATTSPSTY